MINFTYENQGTITYLVYALEASDEIDSMSLGMLTNNKISNIATTIFAQMDADRFIKFNISAKVPVSQFFSGHVNRKRLLGVFSGVIDGLLSAEEYMIDMNCIILDLDYIFVDVSTCEPLLVCLPVEKEKTSTDLGMFFKNIMFNTQFDQTENCDYVAKIMNYLNSTPIFSLADFKDLLISIKNDGSVSQQPVVQAAPVNNTQPKVPVYNAAPVAKPQVSAPAVQSVPQAKPVPQQPVQNIPQPPKTNAVPSAPPAQQVPQMPQITISQPQDNEKKMSMFGLLMHYNKENAEAYKAQKAAKKGAAPAAASVTPAQPPKSNVGFAIPGQQNTGFAIPGQPSAPIPAPAPIPASKPAPAPAPIPQAAKPAQPQPQANYVQPQPIAQPAVPVQQSMPASKPMNFGETTVLGGGAIGETTVLNAGVQNAQQVINPYLVRSKNNEKIPVNKPCFRLGKEKSYVDYFIGDNPAISRGHAQIETDSGKYYIVDTNSTNHTYVDGQMIQSNNRVEITNGTKIRLANEDFEFKFY